ncbi:MAG: CDP-alcohol phosphatidyltransferase family protein [Verrucomicrobiota bacterium]
MESKPQDGLVSRFLNRPISRRVTRLLLKFPIRPNTWTISILILPLVAGLFFIQGDYLSIVIGTAIFQLYSILDGCDGEIARAKNLQSRFGERLDTFCDFVAGLFFVICLGFGRHRLFEGITCAALICGSEWLLANAPHDTEPGAVELGDSFYQRHRGMILHSGLLKLGEKLVWWVFQLTKRDVAVLAFLALALVDRANWILHLWLAVAGGSLLLNGLALLRSHSRRGEITT